MGNSFALGGINQGQSVVSAGRCVNWRVWDVFTHILFSVVERLEGMVSWDCALEDTYAVDSEKSDFFTTAGFPRIEYFKRKEVEAVSLISLESASFLAYSNGQAVHNTPDLRGKTLVLAIIVQCNSIHPHH